LSRAFVAAVVRVGNFAATRGVLDRSTVPVRTTTTGALFVPAAAALGAAIVFEPVSRRPSIRRSQEA
jgi:hypothetical protein